MAQEKHDCFQNFVKVKTMTSLVMGQKDVKYMFINQILKQIELFNFMIFLVNWLNDKRLGFTYNLFEK